MFEEALSQSTDAARSVDLDEACAGQAELRERVEALLAAHDASGEFLDLPTAEMDNRAACHGLAVNVWIIVEVVRQLHDGEKLELVLDQPWQGENKERGAWHGTTRCDECLRPVAMGGALMV